jgi:hypothetical protein
LEGLIVGSKLGDLLGRVDVGYELGSDVGFKLGDLLGRVDIGFKLGDLLG